MEKRFVLLVAVLALIIGYVVAKADTVYLPVVSRAQTAALTGKLVNVWHYRGYAVFRGESEDCEDFLGRIQNGTTLTITEVKQGKCFCTFDAPWGRASAWISAHNVDTTMD